MVKRSFKNSNYQTKIKNEISKLVEFTRIFGYYGISRSYTCPNQDHTTVEYCFCYLIILHLVISLSSSFIAFFMKEKKIFIDRFFIGSIRRFYKTISIHLCLSLIISKITNIEIKYLMIIQQFSMLMFPLFLLIYTLEISEINFLFGIYLMITVEKMEKSIVSENKNTKLLYRILTKLLVIFSSVYSFYILKSTVFAD
jgi:hypothetical protein